MSNILLSVQIQELKLESTLLKIENDKLRQRLDVVEDRLSQLSQLVTNLSNHHHHISVGDLKSSMESFMETGTPFPLFIN